MEHLVTDLECPVCLLTPRQPPIFICPRGHNICLECKPKLSSCPICKEKYKKGSRNFFAEKILDKLERKCRYELFNCDFFTCDSQDLLNHEHICDKKPILSDLLKQEDKSDVDVEDEEVEMNNNAAPIMLDLNPEYDCRPMQHYSAFTVVFLRAIIHEICYKNNIWFELAFIFLMSLMITVRKTRIFGEFIEDYQPDAFNNQVAPLRNNLRFLTFRVANQYFNCLACWILFVIWIIALVKCPFIFSPTADVQTAFFVYKARMDILKPMVVLLTIIVAVLCHLYFEWNRLDRKVLLCGLSMIVLPVVNIVHLELFKDVGSSLNEGQSVIELSYCLIFWSQVIFLPMSHGRICFPLLQVLGLASLSFYVFDTYFNDNQHNVDFDDIYSTAFQDGYFMRKIQEKVMRRSKDEVEKLKFDMLVTQTRLEDIQRKLSLYT